VTDDQIIGSNVINTVDFSGSFDQYLRVGNLERLNSEDQVPLRDANDNLFDVERLIYTDIALALDISGNAGLAYSMYGTFDRAPDLTGLGYWINDFDAGASLQDVAQGFIDSNEFTADYGASPTNVQYVEDLYLNFFNRQPDVAGFKYWVDSLISGSQTQAEVLVNFAISPEYQSLIASNIDNGIQYQVWLGP
jgi:hypothetical protein